MNKSKNKKEPIKPMSAFFIYQMERRPQLITEHPYLKGFESINKMTSEWQSMSEEEKKLYLDLAAEDQDRYEKELENYKSQMAANENNLNSKYDNLNNPIHVQMAEDIHIEFEKELENLNYNFSKGDKFEDFSNIAMNQYNLENYEVAALLVEKLFLCYWTEDNYHATEYLKEIDIDVSKGFLTEEDAKTAAKYYFKD